MWTHRRLVSSLCCLFAIVLGAGHAQAQVSTGTISGTVVDDSGQVIPGATVTVIDERTGAARTETSNQNGEFSFAALSPSTYTVKVELAGFHAFERRNTVVSPGDRLSLGSVKMGVGTVSEVVTVEAKGTQVNPQDSNTSGVLTANQISQIQTKGRDVVTLLRLLPGVRYEDDIEALGDSFGSQIPQIAGQRRHWNQVTVDGLNGNELSGTNRIGTAINLDAISEVKVIQGVGRAEYGRTGGANIEIVSKSGGSAYTGSLYYYGRRDSWNANSWDANRNGLPKARYHFDTYGFNLGGPVKIPGLIDQKDEKKLFFFYSLEAPQVDRPGPVRKYLMPTAAERQGDFSHSVDTAGRPITIKDPLTGLPFPGNIIPANRLDPTGLALLSELPLPNRLDRADTGGTYNFIRQETSHNPRWNHVLRLDYKPGGNDSFFLTMNSFESHQQGSEITAGPEKWGFYNGTYDFGNKLITLGHTHLFSSTMINEFTIGGRRQNEGFGAATDADWARLSRANLGITLPQLYPGLNPSGIIPQALFGGSNSGSGVSNTQFSFDQRLGSKDYDWIFSATDHLTWIRGSHTFKGGLYAEYIQNNEAPGGLWMGQLNYTTGGNNPYDTGNSYANALAGVFRQYSEVDNYRSTQNRAYELEWYVQDTWKTTRRLTLDYGIRFLWYTPYWQANERTAAFVPDRYNPANAPRLYQPALIGGKRVAYDPVTKQQLPVAYIGTFVPGTGDTANGMVPATDHSYPRGFRDQLPPHPEPRVGLAWDVFGNAKTALHASGGLFHQFRLGGGSQGNLQGPPFYNQPVIFGNFVNILGQPGVIGAGRPSDVNGLERDAKTPSVYRWTLGVQQDIGWGTVVDVSYVGSLNRHLEMQVNLNALPDGTRFNPANIDPSQPGRAGSPGQPGTMLDAAFLRPYPGYGAINIRENWGTGNYNGLQVQINRRYIKGFQLGVAYTYSRALGVGDDDPASVDPNRPFDTWNYAPNNYSQTHSLVVNYTWDVPKGSKLWDNAVTRLLLDNWQISGENAFVSGGWAEVTLDTTDNVDFTGGEGGQSSGTYDTVRPNVVGDPQAGKHDPLTGWFNTAAFARPAAGTYGNMPRNIIRLPGINNWNLSAFKNFPLGNRRRLQFRVEGYNVLNHTQFSDVDRAANFDPSGKQVNTRFGLATAARNPRVVQASIRLNF
jgi:hypothetical protein